MREKNARKNAMQCPRIKYCYICVKDKNVSQWCVFLESNPSTYHWSAASGSSVGRQGRWVRFLSSYTAGHKDWLYSGMFAAVARTAFHLCLSSTSISPWHEWRTKTDRYNVILASVRCIFCDLLFLFNLCSFFCICLFFLFLFFLFWWFRNFVLFWYFSFVLFSFPLLMSFLLFYFFLSCYSLLPFLKHLLFLPLHFFLFFFFKKIMPFLSFPCTPPAACRGDDSVCGPFTLPLHLPGT